MPVSSTPTVGTRTAATPASRPDSNAALDFALFGAHARRLGAHDDEPFQACELPVEGAQQARAHAADQLAIDELAAADELAADQVAEAFDELQRWSASDA